MDVDGVYVYNKLHSSGVDVSMIPLPAVPLHCWETISSSNVSEMCSKVPKVTSGMCDTPIV